jgi:signal peptidase I
VSLSRRLVFGANPRRTAIRILVLGALSFLIFGWVLTPIRVRGISMDPTYQDGALNLVNRAVYRFRAPARGDIVAIRLAGPSVLYVKRIVALPGERVAIVSGVVEVNGQPLAEPYVKQRRPWDVAEVTVGPREYFVIGDNRGMRVGDHDFGRVDVRRILGTLVF